jgi:hypothetical protein
MNPRIAILLGRTVWSRDDDGWKAAAYPSGPSREPIARLAEILGSGPARRTVALFEPESLSHQFLETPKVDRAAFASLARVRREHPVVEAEDLGWGIEPPESTAGGAYATLLHAEFTPGLVQVREACAEARCPLVGAWSAYTALAATAPRRAGRGARLALLVTSGYAAVAAIAGSRRWFRSWSGPRSERDLKAVFAALGDAEGTGALAPEALSRAPAITAVVAEEPERMLPGWAELRESGRVDAVLGLDDLAAAAARMPARHPANLVEAFPCPQNLDPVLSGVALSGLVLSLGLGSLIMGDRSRLGSQEAQHRLRSGGLEAQLAHLHANQQEMLRLQAEVPEGFGQLPLEMKAALIRLAAALPDSLTLSSFSVGIDRTFAFEALVVGRGFDAQGARQELERCGFRPGKDQGWTFEPSQGHLRVQGRIEEARP